MSHDAPWPVFFRRPFQFALGRALAQYHFLHAAGRHHTFRPRAEGRRPPLQYKAPFPFGCIL